MYKKVQQKVPERLVIRPTSSYHQRNSSIPNSESTYTSPRLISARNIPANPQLLSSASATPSLFNVSPSISKKSPLDMLMVMSPSYSARDEQLGLQIVSSKVSGLKISPSPVRNIQSARADSIKAQPFYAAAEIQYQKPQEEIIIIKKRPKTGKSQTQEKTAGLSLLIKKNLENASFLPRTQTQSTIKQRYEFSQDFNIRVDSEVVPNSLANIKSKEVSPPKDTYGLSLSRRNSPPREAHGLSRRSDAPQGPTYAQETSVQQAILSNSVSLTKKANQRNRIIMSANKKLKSGGATPKARPQTAAEQIIFNLGNALAGIADGPFIWKEPKVETPHRSGNISVRKINSAQVTRGFKFSQISTHRTSQELPVRGGESPRTQLEKRRPSPERNEKSRADLSAQNKSRKNVEALISPPRGAQFHENVYQNFFDKYHHHQQQSSKRTSVTAYEAPQDLETKLEEGMRPIMQKSVYKNSSQGIPSVGLVPIETKQVKKEIKRVEKHYIERQKIKRQQNGENSDDEFDNFNSEKRRLNILDMKIITQEYAKKAAGEPVIDYERLEKITQNLKFLSSLEKPTRLKLLKAAHYLNLEAGTTIFKKGEASDTVYIILKGSINIKDDKKTLYDVVEDFTISTLYDGDYFGDHSMMGKPKPPPTPEPVKTEQSIFKKGRTKHLDTVNEESGPLNTTVGIDKSIIVPSIARIEPEQNLLTAIDKIDEEEEELVRLVAAEVAETCDLLYLSRNEYQEIFHDLLRKQLEEKLRGLRCLSFLNTFDQFTLLPLANSLVKKTYKYGEVIISAGEEVDRFRILINGRCKLLFGTLRAAPPESDTGRFTPHSPSNHFNTGLPDYSCQDTAVRDSAISLNVAQNKRQEVWKNSKLSFNYDKLDVTGAQTVYLEHVLVGTLMKGDYFGGRALLTNEDFEDDENELFRKTIAMGPARVSVIADRGNTEILELDKTKFEYVSGFLIKTLKNALKKEREFDDFDITQQISRVEEWETLRNKELKEYERTHKQSANLSIPSVV